MKANLLVTLVALVFSACKRQSSDVTLPMSASPVLIQNGKLPCLREFVVNIDQHEGRIIAELHFDSDSVLKAELVRRAALKPQSAVVVRADRRVRYDTVAKTLLLIREAGFTEVYLAFRRTESLPDEDYLRLRE